MIRVIETNLSMDYENNIKDHQSRVIEIDSWEEFIDEIINAKTVLRNSSIGSLHGCTIPRQSKVENLIYDDIHLSCDVYNFAGMKTKKLVYKI